MAKELLDLALGRNDLPEVLKDLEADLAGIIDGMLDGLLGLGSSFTSEEEVCEAKPDTCEDGSVPN